MVARPRHLDPEPGRSIRPVSRSTSLPQARPITATWTDGFTIASVVTIEPVSSPAGSSAGARGLRAEVEARLGSTTSDGRRFIAFDLLTLTLTELGADAATLSDLQASLATLRETVTPREFRALMRIDTALRGTVSKKKDKDEAPKRRIDPPWPERKR